MPLDLSSVTQFLYALLIQKYEHKPLLFLFWSILSSHFVDICIALRDLIQLESFANRDKIQ